MPHGGVTQKLIVWKRLQLKRGLAAQLNELHRLRNNFMIFVNINFTKNTRFGPVKLEHCSQ